ncbi:hypothetical protein FRC03_000727 [Tulasnella sp. 419]|nr:hypothetical protein FRC03_000727 [Tulasnella sp. 419]
MSSSNTVKGIACIWATKILKDALHDVPKPEVARKCSIDPEIWSGITQSIGLLNSCKRDDIDISSLQDVKSQLDDLIKSTTNQIHTLPYYQVTSALRTIHSESCILRSLLDLAFSDLDKDDASGPKWLKAIQRVDMAIITSGAPGEGRLELAQEIIQRIQETYLTVDLTSSSIAFDVPSQLDDDHISRWKPIKRLAEPPSWEEFSKMIQESPFIVEGYANDWPALSERSWRDHLYLVSAGGRARKVPVEVGGDYTKGDWGQELVDWEVFLNSLPRDDGKTLYMAQHNIFNQFPALRSDIEVPDYVYSSPSAPQSFPQYKPPANADQMAMNAWMGPKGTYSPAHTDRYFNCYVQVVGYKSVWVAPPCVSRHMLPHSSEAQMSNTSQVDVFDPTRSSELPDWEREHAVAALLKPGDMLVLPPGWWHAMRSESISFSISFWF